MIGFFLVCTGLIILGEANRRKQLRLDDAVVALKRTSARELKRNFKKLTMSWNGG